MPDDQAYTQTHTSPSVHPVQLYLPSWSIWDMKYRFKRPDGTAIDVTVEDTWRRVAKTLASAEKESLRSDLEEQFYWALEGFKFLPAGRIIAGVGTGRSVTLNNCYVMGNIPDSLDGIFNILKESALTLQQGGGIGMNFSTLRPKGSFVKGVESDASGPVSFMDCWDSMCRTIMSAGYRRGAMMGVMRCDHPDIEDFIEVKRDPNRMRMFNLSVLVTDKFMQAVGEDDEWELKFEVPDDTFGGIRTLAKKVIRARDLWEKIMRSTYEYADPGVIFIDRINQMNNLWYKEAIYATNPCGEQPLPPYGACLLGSINLAALVKNPFGISEKTTTMQPRAGIDQGALRCLVKTAVRMLDNVVDVTNYPLPQQKTEAYNKRRIGLGVTGLADALAMCGIKYGSARAVREATKWMETICHTAYEESTELAAEKGSFSYFDPDFYTQGGFVKTLPPKLQNLIRTRGIRNSHLTSIAPTGTISYFAQYVSGGIEPIFSLVTNRKVLMPDGERQEFTVEDYAYRMYKEVFHLPVVSPADLPDYFVTAQDLTPSDHLSMQAALQKLVDSSISKTINLPEDISYEAFKSVYRGAYLDGCKGCTTFRPNDISGSILTPVADNQTETPVQPETVAAEVAAVETAAPTRVSQSTDLLPRPEAMPGATYKIRWEPAGGSAFYITINNIIEDGVRRPYEIFINSRNVEHYAWTVALTRMISAIFRRGGSLDFVVEELQAVFDPRGGSWIAGKYVPSLLAEIGNTIKRHISDLKQANESVPYTFPEEAEAREVEETEALVDAATFLVQSNAKFMLNFCARCNSPNVEMHEGCKSCNDCGYSTCG